MFDIVVVVVLKSSWSLSAWLDGSLSHEDDEDVYGDGDGGGEDGGGDGGDDIMMSDDILPCNRC